MGRRRQGLAIAGRLRAALLLALGACSSAHDLEATGERSHAPSDGGPAPSAAAAQSPEPSQPRAFDADPESPVFADEVLRRYELTVDAGEWAHINQTAYLEQYIRGSVAVDGVSYEPIGLRFKGFRGSLYNCFDYDEQGNVLGRTCSRLPLKLSFDQYDEAGRFHGLRKLNFHAMRTDPSRMRERLAAWLFRRFGVPAPRVVHALLSVNGEDLGLFALVEEVDGRFARARFPDGGEGNVYKERWPLSSADAAYFESGLESNRNAAELDVSPMLRLALALMGASDATVESVLREHTAFDALMRYLAVDRAIEHWDGITAFRCQAEADVPPLPPEVLAAQTPPLGWEVCQNKNYFWYERTDDDRLWLIAWDLDVTFGSFSQFPDWNTEPGSCPVQQQGRPPRCDRLIDWLATVLRPHYVRAGRELLAGPFQPAVLRAQLETWYAQIAPYVDAATVQPAAEQLLAAVDQHHAELQQDLEGSTP